MRAFIAIMAVASWATMAHATEPSGGPSTNGLVDIPVEEWTAMSAGRTLTYRIDGQFWAMERYHPSTNRLTIQFSDSTCMDGTWEFEAPFYCFNWIGEGRSCFRHVRVGNEILVLETEQGVETGDVQIMSGVSDTPLSCGPATS